MGMVEAVPTASHTTNAWKKENSHSLHAQELTVGATCQEPESVIMFTFLMLSYFIDFDICIHRKTITTLEIVNIPITPRNLLGPLDNLCLCFQPPLVLPSIPGNP